MAQIEKRRIGRKHASLDRQEWTYFCPRKEKLRLPKKPKDMLAEILRILAEVAKVVEFVVKHGGKHQTKNCQPNNYARRLVYQVFRHCDSMDGLKTSKLVKRLLALKAEKDGPVSAKTARAAQENLVFLIYACTFSNSLIGSTERSRAAKLLTQADKHNVNPKHLIGFLLQHASNNDHQTLLVD